MYVTAGVQSTRDGHAYVWTNIIILWKNEKTNRRNATYYVAFLLFVFFGPICGQAIHPIAKTNRKLPATNTLVQMLALYTDPESHKDKAHNTPRYRRTDRQTTPWFMMPMADYSESQYNRLKNTVQYCYTTIRHLFAKRTRELCTTYSIQYRER